MADDHVNNAIEYFLEKKAAEDLNNYLRRGRNLEHLSEQELQDHYKQTLRNFALGERNNNSLEDAQAEFELRGTTPVEDEQTELSLSLMSMEIAHGREAPGTADLEKLIEDTYENRPKAS